MSTAAPRRLSASQKRFLAGALAALVILLAGCGLFTNWVVQLARQTPAPLVLVIPPAVPTLTFTPSPTAWPTTTPTLLPTAAPTFTLLPPTPVVGTILGEVWIHTEPSSASTRTGKSLRTGEQVELLARDGEWVQVRAIAQGQNEASGWIPARWLGVTTSIPAELVTPGALP